MKRNVFSKRDYYKPFDYDWAFKYYEEHEKMHWVPSEVSLLEDIRDWNIKINEWEREFLTQIFRFFTQMDVDVGAGYMDKFSHIFKLPELRMMISSFAAREAVHQHAYALLIDTLGLPESDFIIFKEIPPMMEKHQYLDRFNVENFSHKDDEKMRDLLKCMAVYSGFTEGLQLFGSFCILMNFQRLGKMIGMTTIVDWSIRDEHKHVEGMTHLFRTICEEFSHVYNKDLKDEIYSICEDMVNLEFKFLDLIFDSGKDKIEGITREETKQYIKYIADQRLIQLGLKKIYKNENPFPWMNQIVEGVSHVNFFERRATDYSKGNIIWDFDEVKFND
ncbi:MAG: ribonucleotide-diphosphate reductase subunit beta [Nitrososphaerota archaeon]